MDDHQETRGDIVPHKSNSFEFFANVLFLSETRKAKILLYATAFNCFYFSALLFIVGFLPHHLSSTLNDTVILNVVFASIFYGFFAFILGVSGEFLEFSTKNIQTVYIYISLSSFSLGSILLAHTMGDLNLITGIAAAGSTIAGMVLFETRKILNIFSLAAIAYTLILVLTYTDTIRYAPIMQDTSKYETNPLWTGLVLLVAIPNMAGIMCIGIASILQWKKREQESIYLSQKDILTGINNRGHLMGLLMNSIQAALQKKSSLCVMMIDIDHFKHINDTHGHLAGDKVIVYVAHLIQKNLGHEAYLGRYGGEEFCVILPDTPIEQAEDTAQKIRQCIAQKPFKIDDEEAKHVALSVSIGLTEMDADKPKSDIIDIADDLLYESDHAMYQVKKEGRNDVKTHKKNTP